MSFFTGPLVHWSKRSDRPELLILVETSKIKTQKTQNQIYLRPNASNSTPDPVKAVKNIFFSDFPRSIYLPTLVNFGVNRSR